MPAALPLVEDVPGETPSLWSFGGGATASAGPASVGASGTVGMNQNGGAPESAHLWMAGVMVLALLGLIALHISGFRGMVDVGVAER